MMTRQRQGHCNVRQCWLRVHRYGGLTLGVMLTVVGLTGSVMVFWQPIDAWLNPDLFMVAQPCPVEAHQPVDVWVAAARIHMSSSGRLSRLDFPTPQRVLVLVEYHVPTPEADWDDRYQLLVNPCTGAVTGSRLWDTQRRPWTGPLMAVVMRLHTSLFLNHRPGVWLGNYMLSFGSVLGMILVIVGVYLWWPRNHRWRAAFTVKRGAPPERRNYDIHKTFGIVSAVLLLVSLFTGIHMYSPWTGWIDGTVNLFSRVHALESGAPVSTPTSAAFPITPGQALTMAQHSLKSGTPKFLSFPLNERDVYTVTMGTDTVWDNEVTIDQYSGTVVRISGRMNASAGDRFLGWLFPLHTGQAFGLAGRIMVFLAGLACPVLYITGVIRWRQKQRIARFRAERVRQLQAVSPCE